MLCTVLLYGIGNRGWAQGIVAAALEGANEARNNSNFLSGVREVHVKREGDLMVILTPYNSRLEERVLVLWKVSRALFCCGLS